ncbi:MAG: oligosaccharide flippase family protein [Lachnospiraceae bacterium]|nr:oligosaccharide flippase family protein [Lachnospiraceae bacterium]
MNIQWMAKNLKNRIILSAGIVSYMLLLLLRIPLSRVIGDEGVGLFAPAFELFILTTLVVSYGMSNAMAGIIRYRVKRERYRNAVKVFRTAFVMNLFLCTVMALFLVFFSSWLADVIALEHLGRMAVMAAAPSVFLAALVGIFRGYFSGYGMGVLTAHSQYIEKIAMFVGALLCGRAFYGYGQKVAALYQVEAHSYAYGALGAMLGVFLSQVIALLHLLLVYVIYAGAFKGRPGQDNSRRAETRFEIQRMLVVNMAPLAAVAVLSNLFMIADQRYFNYCMNVTEQGNVRTAQWGCYYGKFAPLLGICAAVSCLAVHGLTGKIANAYEREEYRSMRERMGRAVRNASIVSFPAAVYLAVLGKPFSVCCYGKTTVQSGVLAGWISMGAVVAVLFTFSFLFGQILYKMRMVRELFLAASASFAVHLAAAYFLTQRGHLGVEGLLCALILYFGLYMVLAFVFLNRRVKYRPDWLPAVVFPLAAAAVSGLIVYLINLLLSGVAGAAVCILVSLPVGVFFHILFLVLLRVVGEAELQEMPLGFLFIAIGRTLGVL